MKATERKRLEQKTRKDLVQIIDDLQTSLARWKNTYQPSDAETAPFYWMIGYLGWGSIEDDVDFIPGGTENATAQAAVDAWEDLRQQQLTRAEDQDHLDKELATLLVYRVDEIGRASTDRRWVFRTQKP